MSNVSDGARWHAHRKFVEVPLAVRLRDEAGPPLPQMVAQRRAQLERLSEEIVPNRLFGSTINNDGDAT